MKFQSFKTLSSLAIRQLSKTWTPFLVLGVLAVSSGGVQASDAFVSATYEAMLKNDTYFREFRMVEKFDVYTGKNNKELELLSESLLSKKNRHTFKQNNDAVSLRLKVDGYFGNDKIIDVTKIKDKNRELISKALLLGLVSEIREIRSAELNVDETLWMTLITGEVIDLKNPSYSFLSRRVAEQEAKLTKELAPLYGGSRE